MRDEIKSLWDALHVGPHQQAAFQSFYSEIYTEDLYMKHVEEAHKLKARLDELKPILDLVSQRESYLSDKKELEVADPSRLLSKKSNAQRLLQEEKMRKNIKKIPIIEEKLKEAIEAWESKNQTPFIYNGATYKDIIEEDQVAEQSKREEEKRAKEQKKANATSSLNKTSSPAVTKQMISSTPTSSKLNLNSTVTLSRTPRRTPMISSKESPSKSNLGSTLPLKRNQATPLSPFNPRVVNESERPAKNARIESETASSPFRTPAKKKL
jgi:hypothetical protein